MNCEFHLHLYGCFTPEILYEQGKRLSDIPRWAWFAREYEAAWGKAPTWYWGVENGLEILKSECTLSHPTSFAQFQSVFNLSIALFPAVPEDPFPATVALQCVRDQGVQYAELRMVIPVFFSYSQAQIFLCMLSRAFFAACSEDFHPRLVISLPHAPMTLVSQQYEWVREAMKQDSVVAQMLVALDFCGDEEQYDPREKQAFFRKAHAENRATSYPLRFYYHVGECFSQLGMEAALYRVLQVYELGVHRLSHASVLGIPLRSILRSEPEAEIVRLEALQQEILARLKVDGVVIESCPSSNWILSGISRFEDHPLLRLLRSGVRVVLSSDDPAIFRTGYEEERVFCREKLGITEREMEMLDQYAEHVFFASIARDPRRKGCSLGM